MKGKSNKIDARNMLKRSMFVQMAMRLEEALDLLHGIYYGADMDLHRADIRTVLRETGWIDKDD